jgi:hypothetical protein
MALQSLDRLLEQLFSLIKDDTLPTSSSINPQFDPKALIDDLKHVCFEDIPEDQFGLFNSNFPLYLLTFIYLFI